MPTWAGAYVVPAMLAGMSGKPPQKVACLNMLEKVAKRCPTVVKQSVVNTIPTVTGLVWDVKADVQAAAVTCLDAVLREHGLGRVHHYGGCRAPEAGRHACDGGGAGR